MCFNTRKQSVKKSSKILKTKLWIHSQKRDNKKRKKSLSSSSSLQHRENQTRRNHLLCSIHADAWVWQVEMNEEALPSSCWWNFCWSFHRQLAAVWASVVWVQTERDPPSSSPPRPSLLQDPWPSSASYTHTHTHTYTLWWKCLLIAYKLQNLLSRDK